MRVKLSSRIIVLEIERGSLVEEASQLDICRGTHELVDDT